MTTMRGATARQRAEEVAGRLPPLLVAAERVAATVSQGVHGRRRSGVGETFWQFRHYEFGDAAASIDWRRSARSDQLYVREQEWEAAQSIYLWHDVSPSMTYRSSGEGDSKGDRATLLMLSTMVLLLRGGERVGLLGNPGVPGRGMTAMDRLAVAALQAQETPSGLPGEQPVPRFSQVVLFGDFLAPLPEIDAAIRRLVVQGVTGHMVQVVDPAEETLPFTGRARFSGMGGENAVLIGKVESIRDEYRTRFESHRQGVAAIARAADWTFLSHRTDRPPHRALMALYQALNAAQRAA